MPSVTYEATISGAGEATLGGSRVFYVAWEIAIIGPSVRQPQVWDPNFLLGIGHWELGNDLADLGLIPAVGWGEAHWMNSEVGQWIAPPGVIGTDFSAALATRIRWSIPAGTEVHLYVFGDA